MRALFVVALLATFAVGNLGCGSGSGGSTSSEAGQSLPPAPAQTKTGEATMDPPSLGPPPP